MNLSKSGFGFQYATTIVSHDRTLPKAGGHLYICAFYLSSPPAMTKSLRQIGETLNLEGEQRTTCRGTYNLG